MKKITLLPAIVLLLGINTSLSQTPYIDLTFTGSYAGLHVPLDSIRIINESQLADTMLYGNDTVLRLEYETGIDESILRKGNEFASGEIYPNPFSEKSAIDLFTPAKGKVTAQISDMSGRLLLREEIELSRGLHNFTISSGKEGVCFLVLTFEGKSITKRMVVSGSASGHPSAFSYNGAITDGKAQKSTSSPNSFPFTPGDILRFIGFAATDRDTLQDAPTVDSDYIFIFTRGGFACPGTPTVDFGGQIYSTVQIGNQCWFRENLNIGEFLNSGTLQTNNEVIEKYCFFDMEEYCDTYGGLYQWNELMQYVSTPGSQGICPDGWHVPDEEEWTGLMEFLGGDKDAGGRMKEAGLEHWDAPNTDATNRSGFTALPGGQCEGNGIFTGLSTKAYFWCSSTEGFLNSKFWELRHNSPSLLEGSQVRSFAKSLRCLKDD